MNRTAMIFMAGAWTAVLLLLAWSYAKLLATPRDEQLPPPGSIP